MSAIYRLPAGSTATATGVANCALVAGPLSPLKPRNPVPATVVMTPLAIMRTQLFCVSAMYILPAESMATPPG